MRFEEADQRHEQTGLACSRTKLVRPDSGQVEEALRPPVIAER